MKKIIRGLIILLWLIFFGLIIFYWQDLNLVKGWFYWIEFILLILSIWLFGISSSFILYFALILTLIGGVINVAFGIEFEEAAEFILRLGLVFWLVGVIQNLVLYK